MKIGNFLVHERNNRWGRDFLFMEENGIAVGRVYLYNDDKAVAYIEGLHVSENNRRNRIGTNLINMLIEKCKELDADVCMLWCYTDDWVHDWYKKLGFKDNGEYQYDDNAIWMVKTIRNDGHRI